MSIKYGIRRTDGKNIYDYLHDQVESSDKNKSLIAQRLLSSLENKIKETEGEISASARNGEHPGFIETDIHYSQNVRIGIENKLWACGFGYGNAIRFQAYYSKKPRKIGERKILVTYYCSDIQEELLIEKDIPDTEETKYIIKIFKDANESLNERKKLPNDKELYLGLFKALAADVDSGDTYKEILIRYEKYLKSIGIILNSQTVRNRDNKTLALESEEMKLQERLLWETKRKK